MKKVLILLCSFSFFCLIANSQITKTNWIVGGNFNFSSTKSLNNLGSNSYTSIQLNGSIGYFIKNKLAVGLKPISILTILNLFQMIYGLTQY